MVGLFGLEQYNENQLNSLNELENYNVQNKSFALFWLSDLSAKYLLEIKGEFYDFIKNRFKDEFIANRKLSTDILTIYFEYFS